MACADPDLSMAKALAASVTGCYATADWQEVVAREDVGIVVIATPHHVLAEITEGAINERCHRPLILGTEVLRFGRKQQDFVEST